MKHRRLPMCMVLLASVIFCPALFAATYQELDIVSYAQPDSAAALCQPVAQVLASQFTAATGKTVVQAYCKPADDTLDTASQDIIIGYQADTPLPFTLVTDDADLGYESASACQDDLVRQVQLFRSATKLTEFVGYCTPAHLLKIYALHSSLMQRYGTQMNFAALVDSLSFDAQIADPGRLQTEVSVALTSKGLHLSRVMVDADYLHFASFTYYYYATQPDYRFGIAAVPVFPTMADCLAGVANLHTIVLNAGMEPLVQLCAQNKSGVDDWATLYTFGAQPVPPDAGPIMQSDLHLDYHRAPAESYSSWAACEADRPRLEKEQQLTTPKLVIGSECTVPLDERPMGDAAWHYRAVVFLK